MVTYIIFPVSTFNLLCELAENGLLAELSVIGFRILSWNLDGLSVDKARNPGVINIVGNVLLKYRVKVAVIGGVSDSLALQMVYG